MKLVKNLSKFSKVMSGETIEKIGREEYTVGEREKQRKSLTKESVRKEGCES